MGIQVPVEMVVRLLSLSEIAYPIQRQDDPRRMFALMVQQGMSQGAALARIRTLISHANLQQAIAWMLDNPQQRAEMGARGQAMCRERFSAARMVEHLERLYASVLGR